MDITKYLISLIPIAFLCAAVLAGYHSGRCKSGLSFALFALIWVGLTWLILREAQSRSGFDGIGYVIVIVGLNAPVGAGVLIGGLYGWFRKKE